MILNPFTLNNQSSSNMKINVFEADYRDYKFYLESNYIAFSIAYAYSSNQSLYIYDSPIIVREIVNLSDTYLNVKINCYNDTDALYVGTVSGTTITFDSDSRRTYYITQFLG